MKNITLSEMLEVIQEVRDNIERIEKTVNEMESIILMELDKEDNKIASIEYPRKDNRPAALVLKDVYNFIGENRGKYSKAKGCIWDIDLKTVFNDMGLENEWDNCIAAMKRLGILNKGKSLTVVAKVNGKSKRLHRVNMSRMQDYLKGVFKDC